MRDGFDRLDGKAELAFLGAKEAVRWSVVGIAAGLGLFVMKRTFAS